MLMHKNVVWAYSFATFCKCQMVADFDNAGQALAMLHNFLVSVLYKIDQTEYSTFTAGQLSELLEISVCNSNGFGVSCLLPKHVQHLARLTSLGSPADE